MSGTSRAGANNRKQAVSIRMSGSDIRHIKHLAERLGARDSDVIRFAIKLMLARLAPLQDPSVRGRGLVPVFLESSTELIRHFDLDAAKLDTIINDGAESDRSVEADDIQLIAMSGIQRAYVKLRVAGFRQTQAKEAANGDPAAGVNGHGHGAVDEDPLEQSLRQYLYDKYLFKKSPNPATNPGDGTLKGGGI